MLSVVIFWFNKSVILNDKYKIYELNPARALIRGVVCGIRVEDIEESTMQEIRYLLNSLQK